VEARYDIGDNDRKIDSIYFPVFAPTRVSEASLLDQCNFNADLGGTPLEDIVVVPAPVSSPKLPAGTRIVWFQFMRKDQKEITADGGNALIFRISYWQAHVARHFYYLPQSIAHAAPENGARDWRFPMIIRSLSRTTPDPDSKVDCDRVAELLIVYMRNSEIVSIPAP
jgi:hypothetical protein